MWFVTFFCFLKVGLLPSKKKKKKKLLQWKPFKNDEKWFLFQLFGHEENMVWLERYA